jgi:hypothetical protein
MSSSIGRAATTDDGEITHRHPEGGIAAGEEADSTGGGYLQLTLFSIDM